MDWIRVEDKLPPFEQAKKCIVYGHFSSDESKKKFISTPYFVFDEEGDKVEFFYHTGTLKPLVVSHWAFIEDPKDADGLD